ncbi:MAG: 23S rRNA (adenine(2030)-N(6))-methyltransferase RlmJ [Rhodobacteraceae bacterium]|nr:23S rRNA (adenine(2030)-N(6))-methyltransferase RlmJ [Paracoccaceae bacterium]
MLSYQHAYHAGGPADLHKHIALAELLTLLTRKPRGITYMETHAGRGLYDLASDETAKTGEAAEGIAKIDLPDCPFADAVKSIRAMHGETAYPGSPAIAAALMRESDRMHLMELHPAEFKALRINLEGEASIHRRDGFEGVLAIAPTKPRKSLILVDPSYEVKDEYLQVADFTRKLVAKWPEATVMIWYPILEAARHKEMLAALRLPHLVDEVSFDLKDNKGMTSSGLALVNAPYGSEAVFSRTREIAAQVLR